MPPQLAVAASHSNCSSHTHAPHATENLFFYRSALLWNSLPHNTQSLKNSKSFCNALENHYKSYKCTTTQNFTYHSPLPFLSLQIVCTHIPNCVTSHATIFLQLLDGDPSIRVLPCWGILKYNIQIIIIIIIKKWGHPLLQLRALIILTDWSQQMVPQTFARFTKTAFRNWLT